MTLTEMAERTGTTQELGIPVTKGDMERLDVLTSRYRDHCPDDRSLLLDPSRYSPDQQVARKQFKQRLSMFDCFKGVIGVQGKVGVGKSGWTTVHTLYGREWFDLPVIAYGFNLPEAFGPHLRIFHDEFMDELEATTQITEKRGEKSLQWTDGGKTLSKFYGAQVVVEEAHKLLSKGHNTRISLFFKDFIAEWRHYRAGIFLVTHDLDMLDPKKVGKFITHWVDVSVNETEEDTSDIKIYNATSGEWKPIIELHRKTYYHLWDTNAPIAIRSNITPKNMRQRDAERELRRKMQMGEGTEGEEEDE